MSSEQRIARIKVYLDGAKWGDCTEDEAILLHEAYLAILKERHPGAIIDEECLGGYVTDHAYDEDGELFDDEEKSWSPEMNEIMARAGIK